MRRKFWSRKMVVALSTFTVLLLAAGIAGANSSQRNPEPEIVRVSTADEFVNAIASNTTIILAEGEYNLSQITHGKFSTDEKAWGGLANQMLIISNVRNLTIRGESLGCRIVVEPSYVDVLVFEDCSNITLENITAGHTLQSNSYCVGEVLSFSWCTDIYIKNCHLFGCGIRGLWLDIVRDAVIENSSIYECTYDIMQMWYCRNIVFRNCVFRDTAFTSDAVGIDSSKYITIEGCQFTNIKTDDDSDETNTLFEVQDSEKIVVKNTSFTNVAARDLDRFGLVTFENNTFAGNAFDEAETALSR